MSIGTIWEHCVILRKSVILRGYLFYVKIYEHGSPEVQTFFQCCQYSATSSAFMHRQCEVHALNWLMQILFLLFDTVCVSSAKDEPEVTQ